MKIIELLNTHDFYYAMSDDNRSYESGKAQERQIKELIKKYTANDILPHIAEEWRKELIITNFFS